MEMPDQKQSNKNPKKKIIITLSIIGVVVILLVIAATLVEPPLFKGYLSKDTTTVTKDLETAKTLDAQKVLAPEIVNEPITVPSEEKSEESTPPELVTATKDLVAVTPPKLSFAYLDRLDSNSPSIYGNVSTDSEQVVMIFKLTNSGTAPAYLKEFDTMHTFDSIGCAGTGEYCNHLASQSGELMRLNYDANGNYVDRVFIGRDTGPASTSGNGFFEEHELTNQSALSIKGNSDAYFAIVNDTLKYLYFGNYNTVQARAFIDFSTFVVVDGNDADIGLTIDPNTITPGTMIYK